MGISEIQSPYFNGFVRSRRSEDRIIVASVQSKRWERTPVQTEEEFQRIIEKYLDLTVEGGDEHHPLLVCIRIADGDFHESLVVSADEGVYFPRDPAKAAFAASRKSDRDFC